MTPFTSRDPLVALWQTAPTPDPQHLLQDLQRLDRLHRRLTWTVFATLSAVSLLLIFEEATRNIPTPGWLSGVWVFTLVLGRVWHRRARCNRSDALALATVSLLRSMIARAKSDLTIARCLYAGVPCGALLGFLLMGRLGINPSPRALVTEGRFHLIPLVCGVAILAAMMIAGAVMTRSRRRQIQELERKLRLIETDL